MTNAEVGTTSDLWLRSLKDRDKEPITDTTPNTTVAYSVKSEAGSIIESGLAAHYSNGNWLASVTTPAAGRYLIEWVVDSDGARGKFYSGLTVTQTTL